MEDGVEAVLNGDRDQRLVWDWAEAERVIG
jgi:hypothetical protein